MRDVDEVTGSASWDGWRRAFASLHGANDAASDQRSASPRRRLEWQRSDRYALAWCGGAAQTVSRAPRHVRDDARGAVELLIPLRGRASVETAGAAAELVPGTAVIVDTDRALRMTHDADFESLALVLPRLELADRDRGLAAAEALISTTSGVGALVRQLAVGMHAERHQFDEYAFDTSCDRLLDLAVLATAGSAQVPVAQRHTVAESARRYVRAHAHEDDLDVHRIARALGWSTRHIQGVLRDAGTTARDLIRSERLELARSRLTSPAWADATVSDIAAGCGFSTHSLFSTAFKTEFGLTPTAVRSAA